MTLKPAPIASYLLGADSSTGGDSTNTLSAPNVAVPDASVFDFSGSNDLINCGNNSIFDITSAITVSAWIKASASGWVANFPFFVSKGTNVSYMLFGRKVSSTSLLPRLRIGVNGDPNMVEATTSVNSTDWHHILGTFDGSTMKIYVNGQLDNSKSLSQSIPTGSDDFTIGGNTEGGTSGLISNVQLWNTELSGLEIETLYNSGVPLTGTQPQEANLKAWYKLDQSANWEADTAGEWQIPDAVSSYPQSFDFDGSNDYILLSNDDSYKLQEFSVSLWFKPNVNGADPIFVNGRLANGDYGFEIFQYYGQIRARINNPNQIIGGLIDYPPSPVWNHIFVSYDGTAMKYSINGAAIQTGTLTGTLNYNGYEGIAVGKSVYGYTNGQISNVMFWDSDISASSSLTYNGGVPLTTAIAPDNLKGWWKLDSGVYTQGTAAAGWRVDNSKYPSSYKTAIQTNDGITNGSTGYISTPFNATGTGGSVFGSGSNLDITISFWVYPQYNNSSGIFKMGTTPNRVYPNTHLINIGIGRFHNKIGVTIITGSGSGTIIADYPIYNPSANPNPGLTLETWYHAILTRNSSNNTWSFYLNNILIGTFDDNADLSTQAYATNVYLGNGANKSAKAYHSNYAIWNKHLSTADRTLLYNNGRPLSDLSSLSEQPVSWWKLNNLTTGLQDSVGNNNATATDYVVVKNILVSTQAGVSSGMTEQNLVNNNVSALNGESSGMDTSNLVTSTLTRQIPYNSYSLNFDGEDHCINTNLDLSSVTNITVSSWANWDSFTGYQYVLMLGQPTSYNRTALSISKWSGSGEIYTYDGSTSHRTGTSVLLNTWNNIVVTQAGTERKVYLNGTLISTFTAAALNLGNINSIGRYWDTNSDNYYMNGKLSNVAIWDYSFTSTEVLKLYNGGVPGDLSSFNLNPIAWWSLGSDSYYNGANYICPDLIGTNNGTSSGMGANALVGNAPKSTANGTSTNMTIDANLTGSAPNSSNNSFSINMSFDDRETNVPS